MILFLVEKNVSLLYQYGCLALEPPAYLTRYEITRCIFFLYFFLQILFLAALKLFARHANIFKQFMTEDSEKFFIRITTLCKHKNKQVKENAFLALEAFLSYVAQELISGARSRESDEATFAVCHIILCFLKYF